ncbi:MAG: cysteine desulfurase NifS [Deltaproteobacteria bacterium]|jgi:cysteine desulfurase|nr:cysteine desulfurase NifS [Deltaproteobacteria bacterium]MDH3803356.1 cysteine desulfurase NifS [Deltaproteobacteria bacterium]MDH3929688.1 cysteine desulfurase NifS [Deltaproteobacteria bacterium]
MKTIYVDNNATTRVAPEVVEEMSPYFSELYGNPSSMHFFGGQVQTKVEEARERVAGLIGARPQEIIFTSCGTESDNTAIMSALESNPEKRHVVTTRVEHPAVKNLVGQLKREGYRVTELPVDRDGLLSMDEVSRVIAEDTAIVSVMWANNETGVLFPVEEIANLAKSRGAIFHTDAVQAVGKIPINLAESQIDMLSLSGHKLHAPKGIGVIYVRRGTRFSPYIIGGHQEEGRRGGTENVPYIIGMGKACELAANHLEDMNVRVKGLRDKLENGLLGKIPNSIVNGDRDQRLPNTSSISFEYVEGESILLKLSDKGICASSGSACTSGSLEPSHVLRAMGVPFTAAHGSIRFSLSSYNTEEEIDFILKVMPPIIEKLRAISPFWDGSVARSCSAS